MIDKQNVKVLLFDSGKVLNYPKTGNWFIPPKFFEYIDKDMFQSLDEKLIQKAYYKAYCYLQKNHLILNELEEMKVFVEFYNILFKELKLVISNNIIEYISRDTVYNDQKFVFYDDVFEFIPLFYEEYKLGVVSDTWPSLERVFRNKGLRKYFSTFVIS